ncbi:MAG: hypothetical protein R3330_08405, partial [Saprospiraceae bacterium]|nr:hypothetical protein [Saprospiraceae bacterium]
IMQGDLTVDIAAYSQAGLEDAVIFNSDNPTNDLDLGTPNIVYGGNGISEDDPEGFNTSNNKSMGNLLIVQNPLANEPNDNMISDSIVFTFSKPIYLISMVVVDIELQQALSGAGAFMYDDDGMLLGFVPFLGGGDNNLEVVSLNTNGVSKLVMYYGGEIFQSGAVGEICYTDLDLDLELPVYEDDCGNATVTVAENIVEAECTIVVAREYSAEDECGNVGETCTQITTLVIDAICPEIMCPDDLFIPCGAPVPAPDPSSVVAIDNCTPQSDIIIAHVEDIVEGTGCDEVIRRIYSATDTCGNMSLCVQFIRRTIGVMVDASVYLQAAMNADSNGMDANINAYLPLSQPYGMAPFLYAGTEAVGAMPANVVDWMLMELRDQNTQLVVETRAALLLTTGQIVDMDGVSPVSFGSPPDFYYLTIRHRNHLDIISSAAIDFTSGSGGCDFTNGCALPAGMHEIASPNAYAMYMGDINGDQTVRYNNAFNDKNLVLAAVGLFTPNNFLFAGYYTEDVNMDGEVRYNNANNDKNSILEVVGLFSPNNFIFGLLY